MSINELTISTKLNAISEWKRANNIKEAARKIKESSCKIRQCIKNRYKVKYFARKLPQKLTLDKMQRFQAY